MSGRQDAGLEAVARVRGVREQDDRLGLQLALAESRALHGRADQLRALLTTTTTDGAMTPRQLLSQRIDLGRIGDAARETSRNAVSADVVSAEARVRWEGAKTRLSAVERLIEMREARRLAAAEHSRAKEADDIAAQRWLRAQTATNRREVAE